VPPPLSALAAIARLDDDRLAGDKPSSIRDSRGMWRVWCSRGTGGKPFLGLPFAGRSFDDRRRWAPPGHVRGENGGAGGIVGR
jgi:hypothetical protein